MGAIRTIEGRDRDGEDQLIDELGRGALLLGEWKGADRLVQRAGGRHRVRSRDRAGWGRRGV
jgi:hypothetical protein